VSAVAFSPDGKYLVSYSHIDNKLLFWQVRKPCLFTVTILMIVLRIRQQIDDMQFGFMKGKGTTDAIIIVRQMQEKFRANERSSVFVLWIWKKLLHISFITADKN